MDLTMKVSKQHAWSSQAAYIRISLKSNRIQGTTVTGRKRRII